MEQPTAMIPALAFCAFLLAAASSPCFGQAPRREWNRILGSRAYDYGQAVSVDGTGNVHVAGNTEGSFDARTNAGAVKKDVASLEAGPKIWLCFWE